jgi:hypothetical protein
LFRFIHVSDTHLGYRPQGFLERERDFYDAFRWVVDKALELRVDAVLHAGDLFHNSTPRPATYLRAIGELRRLAEAGVAFVVAPGNHELPRAEGLGSPVKVLESLGLARPVGDYGRPWPVELDGATVIVFSEWASDYLGKADPASLARSKARVGLAHVTLCDALAEAEGVPPDRCRGPRRMHSSMVRGGLRLPSPRRHSHALGAQGSRGPAHGLPRLHRVPRRGRVQEEPRGQVRVPRGAGRRWRPR